MEWYVPVSSHYTRDYIVNVPWKFKVKLNLHLPGHGWKVRIAYALIPPMSLLKPLQSVSENLMELHLVSKKPGQPDQVQKAVLKGSDVSAWESEGLCETGLDFFNTVKHYLEESLHAALSKGYQYTKQTWQTLEWSKEGIEPELVLKPGVKGNKVVFSKDMGRAFGWVESSNDWQRAGANLVHSYAQHKKGGTSFSNDYPLNQNLNVFYLSTLSEWRFINLNRSFNQASQLTPRPLKVIATIQQDGQGVEQDLGVIQFEPEGRTDTLYVPTQEFFYNTSVSDWGEVEFTIKEFSKNLDVPFVTSRNLYLILHFKQA